MIDLGLPLGLVVALGAALLYLASSVRIVQEYQRGVTFFLGKYAGLREPGLRFVFPPFVRMRVIDLRTVVEDIPPQEVITRDNVSAKVNAVLYFRVMHADKAVLNVVDYLYATSQLAQTSLRSIVGAHDLDDLLTQRDKLNQKLQEIIDEASDPWGIKVASVEIKHVEVPPEMRRAMAKQAEAERERRAKIINAEGELQASAKLAEAAAALAKEPMTIQLRYLQTLVEVAAENNSTTLFPIPMEFMHLFKRPPNT